MGKGKKTAEAVLCGQRMREARGDRSQSEFAKLLGILPSTLGNYEQGLRKLPIRLAVRAQQATGVPAAYLMGLVDEADRDLLMAPNGARAALLSAIRQLQP
jgi:transcriptional regulator with XRE-family HTH domain